LTSIYCIWFSDIVLGKITPVTFRFSARKLMCVSAGDLCRADKGDTLKASYLHTVSPTSRTTVAAEIAHKISKNENTFTVGGLYELDILTTVKARLNNHGKVAALLQHEWRPKSLVTISGEVDTKALDKSAKLGLAIALKP
jgi:voltage-dependent anion channel protein 2